MTGRNAVDVGGRDVAAVTALQPYAQAVLIARRPRAAEDAHGRHEPLLEAPLDLGALPLVLAHLLEARLAEVLVPLLFLQVASFAFARGT